MSPSTPLVLVAYGSSASAERVGALVAQLRMGGIDVIEQLLADPVAGAPELQIAEHDIVLLVWSPLEGERLYERLARSDELAIVFFEEGTEGDMPSVPPHRQLRLPGDYDELYGWLSRRRFAPPATPATARSSSRSWEEQIFAAQHAGDVEVREGTDVVWSHARGTAVGPDDHLWDTGSAASLDVLARRIPATTSSSTIIVDGRVRPMQRPTLRCPDCQGTLRPAVVSVRFELAPAATAAQQVPGHRCACGSEWPEPAAMRAAHAAAFELTGSRPA